MASLRDHVARRIIQNATLALMIDRLPVSGLGTASALWNLAYDAGYGAGSAVFGLFVGHTGYPVAFALTGLLMLAALPAGRRERAAAAGAGRGLRAGQGAGAGLGRRTEP